MTPVYVLLAAILGVCLVGFFWKKSSGPVSDTKLVDENASLKADNKHLSQELGKIQKSLEHEQSEKNEFIGKNKTLFAQHESVKADLKHLSQERDALKKQVTKYEAEEDRRLKDIEMQTMNLKNAQKGFEDERQRLLREDERRMKELEEERDRLWAEHENNVISVLTDLCKQPLFSFTAFTNTNLPEGFDGSLKPDFMIDFLGQYVIFDAKISKSKSLREYINDQVKKTVQKVKSNEKIYKSIFLVVPSTELRDLKAHHHIIDGYSIFIVGPESLGPILASLKRVSMYEFAEQMDPLQRENIVQLIAELDFHINLRNAADILLTKMGTDILEKAQRVDPEIAAEVALKKQPMNAKAANAIAGADLKKLVNSLMGQVEEAHQLVSPKASIRKKELKAAGTLITETLFE